jgi:serine/threonine protein kinase
MDPARHIRGEPHSSEAAVDVRVDSDVFDLRCRRLASTDELAPGVRISENIRLRSLLRTGGMANVWIAEHAGLETRVAVKFMSGQLATNAGYVARFRAEAKIAARIKSPHVVNILDYAISPAGLPYIVMELLEGEDLEMRLRSASPLSFEDSSRVLVQICKALAKAHALGIVHRDIKPDNVFLVAHEGELFVKLLDFGIAKDETRPESVTAAGIMMGTPSFMSPEQIFRPREVDHRSDLWSAAVVAYRCLTGTLPFVGDTFGAMCLSTHDGQFTAPSSIEPALPRELDKWFEKALNVDPSARFHSASEMANAYLAHVAKARLLPQWEGAERPKRLRYGRRPAAVTLVIALVVAAVSILATSRERSASFSLVGGSVGASSAGSVAQLNPPPLAPPPEVTQPVPPSDPRARVPAPPPIFVKRDVTRAVRPAPAVPRKAVSDNPYDLPATPTKPAERGAPRPLPPNDQFGI